MIAAPILPGRAYRVRHRGATLVVIAPDACAAIAFALARLIGEEALPCAA